ncbi:hypothetical protein ABZU76_09285 [Amycolatopsis sp. NPDC005232]|uniref:hypothetical protein n=1 Tax=Amycolatopsis sp. NPDC005232 TaxID=3157027 RepID=UPI0033B4F833
MNTLTPTQILVAVTILLALVWAWWSGARRARAAAEASRTRTRLVSLTGRVLLNAGLLVTVQWAVIANATSTWLLLAVLGLPALFAAYALTRATTITTLDPPARDSH